MMNEIQSSVQLPPEPTGDTHRQERDSFKISGEIRQSKHTFTHPPTSNFIKVTVWGFLLFVCLAQTYKGKEREREILISRGYGSNGMLETRKQMN